jgi:hypothetical protein
MRCSAIAKSTNVRCKSVATMGSEFCIHHVPKTSIVTKFDNKDDSECNLGEIIQTLSVSSVEEISTPEAPTVVADGYISGFMKYLGIW